MQWSLTLRDGQKLIVNKEFWTGKTEVRLDNRIVGKMGMVREQTFPLAMKDEKEHSLTVKHCLLDPIPQLLLDGRDLMSSERFNKWQTAILCLPALLVVQLGAIPALIGVGGVYLNFFIARQKDWVPPLRWTAIGLVPVIGFVITAGVSALVWGGVDKPHHEKLGGRHYGKTVGPIKMYDPRDDDNDPRLWAKPPANAEAAERGARAARWVEEGR